MSPTIENPGRLDLPPAVKQILQIMFDGYQRVIIRKEFGYGLSGGRVIEVRPIKADGTPELPTVVKSATLSLIQKEWQAYQQHIRRRLPYIAEIKGEPVLLPEIGWGGLRYNLMGGGTFEVVTLRDYCRRAELTAADMGSILERLLKIMHHIWGYNHIRPEFLLQSHYDYLLPVNLLIEHRPALLAKQLYALSPETLPVEPVQVGDLVHVSGFAINKVNLITQTMTLNRPETMPNAPAFYLRCRSPLVESLATYPVNQVIDPIEGEVIETRFSRLEEEARRTLGETFEPAAPTILLPETETSLPNPLAALPSLLNKTLDVKVAVIHGDFNFENILIEPETGTISLIDFAEAREDHILHDFLRLETEVMTKLLPEILHRHNLPPVPTLLSFYQQLHRLTFQASSAQLSLSHPALEKPFAMLTTIRQTARKYLFDWDDPTEYYQGLIIYLLSALKFKNLNQVPEAPLPKQVAFWSAALAYRHLTDRTSERGLKQKSAAPFQTPRDVPQFVGREKELAQFSNLLTRTAKQNIYCLTGMGGIGKTSLAIRLAYLLQDHFSDGVLWANMADSEPLAILDSWARAYGYDFSSLPDLASRAAALRGELVDKKILMILDDVWSADKVRPLLPSGAQSTVLLTSRNVDLAVAVGAQVLKVSVLTTAEGRQLLIRIVGQERVLAEETAANEICRLLGNLPLAVKIVARRLASRPRWRLIDMAERLRDEKQRLAELKISDREVRVSFAVSWAALDKNLRRTFALLAVFEGRLFSAAALAAVAELDRRTAEDQLASLVALSLASEESEQYYRQHPLLVDFAREHLGEDQAAYERMAQYYLAYASKHQRDYLELEQEWDNLLAGMRVAHQRSLWPLIINYANTLAEAWFARARFSDMRQGYQWACEAALALTDHPTYAFALYQWGRACIEQGDYAEAEEHLTQSLQLYQELNEQAGIATALYYLGRIAVEQANYDEAQKLLEESQRKREQLGDVSGVAETLYQQVYIQYDNRNLEKAKWLAKQALAMQQTTGDKLGCIRTLGKLADIAIKQDELDSGEKYCQRALALCEEIQEKGELAIILYILAEVYRCKGALQAARDYAERSLDMLTRMGDRKMQAWALWRLSVIDTDLGDYALALQEGFQSLNIQRDLNNSWNMIYVFRQLGDIHQALNQSDQAREMWSEALSLAEPLQHPLIDLLRERLQIGL